MKQRLKVLLAWVLVIGAWEAAYRIVQWPAWQFPAPSHVIDATLAMLGVETHFGDPVSRGWPLRPSGGDEHTEAAGRPSAVLPEARIRRISGSQLTWLTGCEAAALTGCACAGEPGVRPMARQTAS